jgi:hypothetical protein
MQPKLTAVQPRPGRMQSTLIGVPRRHAVEE